MSEDDGPESLALRAGTEAGAPPAVVECGVCGAHLDSSGLSSWAPGNGGNGAPPPAGPVRIEPSDGRDDGILVLRPVGRRASPPDGTDGLTPREHDIVRLLMRGYRVASIARLLGIAPSTVHNHLRTVRMKYGVGSQAELVELLHERSERQAGY